MMGASGSSCTSLPEPVRILDTPVVNREIELPKSATPVVNRETTPPTKQFLS